MNLIIVNMEIFGWFTVWLNFASWYIITCITCIFAMLAFIECEGNTYKLEDYNLSCSIFVDHYGVLLLSLAFVFAYVAYISRDIIHEFNEVCKQSSFEYVPTTWENNFYPIARTRRHWRIQEIHNIRPYLSDLVHYVCDVFIYKTFSEKDDIEK